MNVRPLIRLGAAAAVAAMVALAPWRVAAAPRPSAGPDLDDWFNEYMKKVAFPEGPTTIEWTKPPAL